MKKIIVIMLLSLFLVSCGPKLPKLKDDEVKAGVAEAFCEKFGRCESYSMKIRHNVDKKELKDRILGEGTFNYRYGHVTADFAANYRFYESYDGYDYDTYYEWANVEGKLDGEKYGKTTKGAFYFKHVSTTCYVTAEYSIRVAEVDYENKTVRIEGSMRTTEHHESDGKDYINEEDISGEYSLKSDVIASGSNEGRDYQLLEYYITMPALIEYLPEYDMDLHFSLSEGYTAEIEDYGLYDSVVYE